jgi:Zn-dependent peptidase ImmA (M78 family)/DNA-binding XRE family transcriptional regulator
MKIGTPGFLGARLREAREARGLTGLALAEIVGVTAAAISDYERGPKTPRPDVMDRICETLNLPLEFFTRPVVDRVRNPIHYRSLSAATKSHRLRAERRHDWLLEIVAYLRGFVSFPEPNVPLMDVPEDPTELSDERIEEIAGEVRWRWNLGEGPISNVVLLLENNGVIVTRGALGAHTLDAFSRIGESDGVPYIFLGDDKRAAGRSRFDAAHELAHLVLHRHVSESVARKSELFKLMEEQAHRFAGAFLLPARSFGKEVTRIGLDPFLALKPRWRVSVALMIKRAENLGWINEHQAQILWIQYGRRRWRGHEPLDDKLPVEEPRLLRRAVELLVSQGVQTVEDIRFRNPFAPTDIEQLVGLPPGFLSGDTAAVRLKDVDTKALPPGGAKVLQFPKRPGGT